MSNQLGIDAFQIGQDNQLLQIGLIPDISLSVWVCLPPFLCSHAKHCDVQHICLIGIGNTLLPRGYVRRNQHFFNSIRMDSVIDFGQSPVQIPSKSKPTVFVGLQSLVIFDDIQLKLG